MKRREFITALSGAVVAWPLAAPAQQVARVHRVGLIISTSPVSEMVGRDPTNPLARVFVHALRGLGYVESRNLILERRSAEGKFERWPEIVRELISIKTEVIVSLSADPITLAVKEVTQSVPIVIISSDPVASGLAQSLAHPGGNITGLTTGTGPENWAKDIQLLKDPVPGMSRVAYLQDKREYPPWLPQGIRGLEQELGIKVLLSGPTASMDYVETFALIARERADALFVDPVGRNFANRRLILELAANNRLPASYILKEYVAAGGLVAHGPDFSDVFRRLAGFVDRILKGAKPADLPFERPAKFVLAINLKTAKTLGLTIPPSLLIRADELIE